MRFIYCQRSVIINFKNVFSFIAAAKRIETHRLGFFLEKKTHKHLIIYLYDLPHLQLKHIMELSNGFKNLNALSMMVLKVLSSLNKIKMKLQISDNCASKFMNL